MITVLLILLGLLCWAGLGVFTLYLLTCVKRIEIGGPIQALAVLTLWPPYLIYSVVKLKSK